MLRIHRGIMAGIALSVSVVMSLVGPMAFAAQTATSTGTANGMKVSPVRTDLVINAGESKTVQVTIQNVTQKTEQLQVLVNDFVADQSEDGSPALLLNGTQAPQHSLKQFVQPIPNVTVGPNQAKDVNAVITIPENAPAGGYFGAVRFAPASASDKQVQLSASVASLILVTVPGNVKEEMSIASFNATNKAGDAQTIFTSGKSVQTLVRFKNSGNVQEQPFGKILLKRGGKVLATYEVNNTDPRGNVLPDSIRKFSVPLDKVGSFGKYTLEGNFGYGTNGQLLTASTTFYVIPLGLIIGGVVAIILILLAAFGLPRLLRSHDKRVLRNAGRR